MKKLLVICGPTATGKTRLGIYLAEKFNGEIISADSRQVYKNMDIGTGKDLPSTSKFQISTIRWKQKNVGFYKINDVVIWCYDLVTPKEDFSVSKYLEVAEKVLFDIEKRGKLPILVGGSGLYIKAIVDGIATAGIPRNNKLRKSLQKKSVEELYETLAALDPSRAANMNFSDRKNPRRLIRAIEVAQWKILHRKVKSKNLTKDRDVLMIGLSLKRSLLDKRINKRIRKRLSLGIIEEVRKLLSSGVSWNYQSMDSLGYRQWKDYLLGKKTKKEVIDSWFHDERNYARRQLIWFKKDKRIIWFEVDKPNWQKKIENLVENWYYKENATQN